MNPTVEPARHPMLVCFGEVLWDLLASGPRPGGAPANCAVNARLLGVSSLLISAVGMDTRGETLLTLLRRHEVNVEGVARLGGKATGTVAVALDAAGSPTYEITRDVAWDHIPASRGVLEAAARADALCFGSLVQRSVGSRRTLEAVLEATTRDCLRFFDVNLRAPYSDAATILASLRRTTVLKLNNHELAPLRLMAGVRSDEPTAFAREMFDRFPLRAIIITRGAAGALLFTPTRELAIPAEAVPGFVDSVGAGDAFSAGFLAGALRGWSFEDAARLGSKTAAEVCGCSGAWPEVSYHA